MALLLLPLPTFRAWSHVGQMMKYNELEKQNSECYYKIQILMESFNQFRIHCFIYRIMQLVYSLDFSLFFKIFNYKTSNYNSLAEWQKHFEFCYFQLRFVFPSNSWKTGMPHLKDWCVVFIFKYTKQNNECRKLFRMNSEHRNNHHKTFHIFHQRVGC